MRSTSICPALLLALLLGGCGPRTRSVTVTLANRTDQPMIAWLTKDGPPVEMRWLSPAQFAVIFDAQPADQERTPGIDLPGGATVRIGPREGKFYRNTLPLLHVYAAPASLDEMSATEKRSPLRAIVPLTLGENAVAITSASPVRASRGRVP